MLFPESNSCYLLASNRSDPHPTRHSCSKLCHKEIPCLSLFLRMATKTVLFITSSSVTKDNKPRKRVLEEKNRWKISQMPRDPPPPPFHTYLGWGWTDWEVIRRTRMYSWHWIVPSGTLRRVRWIDISGYYIILPYTTYSIEQILLLRSSNALFDKRKIFFSKSHFLPQILRNVLILCQQVIEHSDRGVFMLKKMQSTIF